MGNGVVERKLTPEELVHVLRDLQNQGELIFSVIENLGKVAFEKDDFLYFDKVPIKVELPRCMWVMFQAVVEQTGLSYQQVITFLLHFAFSQTVGRNLLDAAIEQFVTKE